MSNYLRPHESQHARPPCPSPTPGVYSNSCPWSPWCHSAISSSVVPFSSCPQSFPTSGSFLMIQLFAWGGQSIGVSASASVLPMNTQDWSPLGWTGWVSLQSKGLSRVFSNTTVCIEPCIFLEGLLSQIIMYFHLCNRLLQFSSVAQTCPTLCNTMDCSTPGLPVHHQLLELTQTHVYWVGDAIQPSHHLSSTFPPAFNLSLHQGIFQWVSSSHRVAKELEFKLQHQSFQWMFRTDFL